LYVHFVRFHTTTTTIDTTTTNNNNTNTATNNINTNNNELDPCGIDGRLFTTDVSANFKVT